MTPEDRKKKAIHDFLAWLQQPYVKVAKELRSPAIRNQLWRYRIQVRNAEGETIGTKTRPDYKLSYDKRLGKLVLEGPKKKAKPD
jgi:hypothetical protein